MKKNKIIIIEDNETHFSWITDAIKKAPFNTQGTPFEFNTYIEFSDLYDQWKSPEDKDNILISFCSYIKKIEENYLIKGFILDKCLFEDDQSDNDNSEYTCQDETGLLLRDFIRDGKVFPIAEKNKSDYIPIIVMTSDKNPEKQNLHLEKNTRAIVKTPHTILLSGMRILDEEINKYVQQLKGDNDMEMAKNIDNSINIYDSNNVQIQKDTRNSTQTFKFVIKNEDIKKLKNECNELLNNLNYSNTDNLELGAEINKLNQNLNSDSISKENILTHIEKISNIINTFKSNNPETIALITEYAPVLWDYCSKFIG